jgi:hypothetical protein
LKFEFVWDNTVVEVVDRFLVQEMLSIIWHQVIKDKIRHNTRYRP